MNNSNTSNQKLNEAFDFKEDPSLPLSFAEDYLRQYYSHSRDVADDEKAIFKFIHKNSAILKDLNNCIEVGCGPTLHHAIMLAPYIKQLILSDYLEENLVFVRSWVDCLPTAWNWNKYTNYCLAEEGVKPTPESIKAREELTRSKIKNLKSVNLLSSTPLGTEQQQFDLVAAFYCTEEIALTKTRWQEVITSLTSIIKPGGYLLMSCLADSNYYHICRSDGSVKELPCVKISEIDVKQTLENLKFDMNNIIIEFTHTPSQSEEGVPGVILTLAHKLNDI